MKTSESVSGWESLLFIIFMYVILGLIPGIGLPVALTWSLSGYMATWSPLSVLLLILVALVWLVSLIWLLISTITCVGFIKDEL